MAEIKDAAAKVVTCTDCGRVNVRQWFQHDDETVCPPCELARQGVEVASSRANSLREANEKVYAAWLADFNAPSCLNGEPCCPCEPGCCGCS